MLLNFLSLGSIRSRRNTTSHVAQAIESVRTELDCFNNHIATWNGTSIGAIPLVSKSDEFLSRTKARKLSIQHSQVLAAEEAVLIADKAADLARSLGKTVQILIAAKRKKTTTPFLNELASRHFQVCRSEVVDFYDAILHTIPADTESATKVVEMMKDVDSVMQSGIVAFLTTDSTNILDVN
jgi:hypothetical protein